ncbi:MAG: sulfate ABC transporter permease subunit CysT [Bryobacteraceae bacterium]|jgi:sulfate transport system permease protein
MIRLRQHSVIPGFGLTLGYTLSYLSLIVLIPLSALAVKGAAQPWAQFSEAVFDPRTLAAWRLTFGTALIASLINAFFGLIIAWTLVRYDFPGRRILDALIDVPFALPTAVSGIALTAIYSQNGWMGRWLQPLGIKAAFSPLGIVIALTFIGLPFIVRTVQPAVEDLDPAVEEAASLLGASRLTALRRVILPALQPALIAGFITAFARALGEYGSVIFISGNMPMKTEIASLLIVTKLEQFDYAGAAAIGLLMLVSSFVLLFLVNAGQWWCTRHLRRVA